MNLVSGNSAPVSERCLPATLNFGGWGIALSPSSPPANPPLSNDAIAEIANMEVALVERLRSGRVRVPPYPATAMRLRALLDNPRWTTTELEATVATDAAIAPAIVRLANTADAYRGASTLSLGAAVAKLGGQPVAELALASSLGTVASASGVLGALRRDAWRRSLLAARLCQTLAPTRRLAVDTAYMAGLLHDFGAIVAVATLEDIGNKTRLAKLPEWAWHELLAKFRSEYGLVVAQRWSLPEEIVDVISRCRDDAQAQQSPLTALAATAVTVIAALDGAPGQGTAALDAIAALTATERSKIPTVLATVQRDIGIFEPKEERSVVTAVIAPPLAEGGLPCSYAAHVSSSKYRAVALWHDAVRLIGDTPLQPSWLVDVALDSTPAVKALCYVRGCENTTAGYSSIVQPYALDAAQRQVWQQLVDVSHGS